MKRAQKTDTSPRAALLPKLGEVFRTYGYEGASLTLITAATGLGKGSLYHLFPGGKQQMAAEVLTEIDQWFEREVFAPLRDSAEPHAGIAHMFRATDDYFRSGRRVCLVGVFALGAARDEFTDAVQGYFDRWREALAQALRRAGQARAEAMELSEDILAGMQGALVLARAADDHKIFSRALKRMAERVPKRVG
ncbi:MAG: TetR/AcrR family transcriptional regulator [Proteobacteria bacterium]|nr:TetR/AcrR family transcriptional regulator [Pseudomonadota bacterium]